MNYTTTTNLCLVNLTTSAAVAAKEQNWTKKINFLEAKKKPKPGSNKNKKHQQILATGDFVSNLSRLLFTSHSLKHPWTHTDPSISSPLA